MGMSLLVFSITEFPSSAYNKQIPNSSNSSYHTLTYFYHSLLHFWVIYNLCPNCDFSSWLNYSNTKYCNFQGELCMQRIKSAIKKAFATDPFDLVVYGQPLRQDYSLAIHTFHSLPHHKRTEVSQALTRRLQKQHSNRYTLSLLVLCDFLSATAPEVLEGNFPEEMMEKYQKKGRMQVNNKEEKIQLGESNFLLFYLQYLRIKAWDCLSMQEEGNVLQKYFDVKKSLELCENNLKSIKLIFKYDFVMDFVIKASQNSYTICLALQNILRRVSEDLALCIRFVEKWSYLIITGSQEKEKRKQGKTQSGKQIVINCLQDQGDENELENQTKAKFQICKQNKQISLRINEVYEQLIYISKNVDKFQILRRRVISKYKQIFNLASHTDFKPSKDNHKKIQIQHIQSFQSLHFPVYRLNKELNSTIEQCMMEREAERKEYLTSRLSKVMIRTQGDESVKSQRGKERGESKKMRVMQEEGMEITESQIFVNVKI